MDYWTLKKKAIMGSMQSGRLAEAEGYPLKLENAIKGSMKDYRIWGNKKGKNLLNIPHLNISTTSRAYVDYRSTPMFKLEPSTTYYYSFEYVINSATERLGTSVGRGITQYSADIVYREVWKNQNIGERAKFTMSFTTPDSFVHANGRVLDRLFFRIRSYNNEGFDVDTYNHMLTTIPDYYEYEPYQENDGLGALSGNLLDTDYFSVSFIGSSNGITFVDNQDGTITLNGTATSEAVIGIILSSKYLKIPAGNYVLSGGTSTVWLQGKMKADDTISWLDKGNGVILSLSEDIDFRFNIRVRAGTTLNNFVVKPQLRQYNYIDVVTSGKNMLKATDVYKNASNYQELVEDGRNCIRFVDNAERKYYYPFKENTRYTISFDCKITTRSTASTNASLILRVVYTDGTQSNVILYDSQKDTWIHKTLITLANRTISWIGLQSYSYVHWCYIDIDTFQFEEGTTETPYEPFREPTTTTIDLTGHNSIMPNEYIDFKNGCIVRSDGTEEEIILPKIPLHKGYNILTASDAELESTKMYGKYLKKG